MKEEAQKAAREMNQVKVNDKHLRVDVDAREKRIATAGNVGADPGA